MRMIKMIASIAFMAVLAVFGNQWVRAARLAAPTNSVPASTTDLPPAISSLLDSEADESELQPAINLLLAEDDESLLPYRVYIPLVLNNYSW